ncbi:MAG TPA: DUF924 family protein [Thermohalobaculum sp.]|nr:DUF924 family protein [Thermohalobaculum sp.]
MTPDADEVLRFWLDEVRPARWYEVDPELDATILARFEGLWQDAAEGRLDPWLTSPRGALALVIVLDQFPRNMFRGTAEAYRTDRRALRAANEALRRRFDQAVPEPERQFFYLPLMHAEDLPLQERAVRLIALRLPETGAGNLEHARRHREVIRRFGRFPSRNPALGRRDTEAERHYRAGGGYMG